MVETMADVAIALAIALLSLLYIRGVRVLWTVAGPGRIIRHWQVYAFAGGVLALLVALASPLEQEAGQTAAWHMVQHVLLLTVAAPLLAASAPLTAWLYALPDRHRQCVQPAWRRILRSQSDRGWFVWTAIAFVVANCTLAVWHLPFLYDAAVRNGFVHVAEHVSFVATSMFFWWMVLGAAQRSRRGFGVLGVFLMTLPATALGVLMTMASTPWYDVYGRGATALRDQQIAGAVMWGFAAIAMVAGAAALFAGWLAGMDRADERAATRTAVEPS
jgi:putative membrane protein